MLTKWKNGETKLEILVIIFGEVKEMHEINEKKKEIKFLREQYKEKKSVYRNIINDLLSNRKERKEIREKILNLKSEIKKLREE